MDCRRILEVFPSAFLGMMIPDDDFPSLRRDASDRFWDIVTASGSLEGLLTEFIPGVRLGEPLTNIRDHDQRAASVCAVAVLAVARGRYVAIGDPVDGDIILPPLETWGYSSTSTIPWAEKALRENLALVRQNRGGYPNHERARILRDGRPWF